MAKELVHVDDVLAGISLGRTLQQIERETGLAIEDLSRDLFGSDRSLALQRAREISAYVLDDEALDLIREAVREPTALNKLKAISLLAQHVRWSAERRNPAVYAAKPATAITVPVQINTSLDLAGGSLEGVYKLEGGAGDPPDGVLPPPEPLGNLAGEERPQEPHPSSVAGTQPGESDGAEPEGQSGVVLSQQREGAVAK